MDQISVHMSATTGHVSGLFSLNLHFLTVFFLVRANPLAGKNISAERSSKYGVFDGCFSNDCLRTNYNAPYPNKSSITIDYCTRSCQDLGYSFAGVQNQNCSCSCNISCFNESVDDKKCGVPCAGTERSGSAQKRFCGGLNYTSIYHVHQKKGICKNVHNQSKGFASSDITLWVVIGSVTLVIITSILSGLFCLVKICHKRKSGLEGISSSRSHGTANGQDGGPCSSHSKEFNQRLVLQGSVGVMGATPQCTHDCERDNSHELYAMPDHDAHEYALPQIPNRGQETCDFGGVVHLRGDDVNTQNGAKGVNKQSDKETDYVYAESRYHLGGYSKKSATLCRIQYDPEMDVDGMVANNFYSTCEEFTDQ